MSEMTEWSSVSYLYLIKGIFSWFWILVRTSLLIGEFVWFFNGFSIKILARSLPSKLKSSSNNP